MTGGFEGSVETDFGVELLFFRLFLLFDLDLLRRVRSEDVVGGCPLEVAVVTARGHSVRGVT